MGERSSNLGDIHLHKKAKNVGERSGNFIDIHLHKKEDQYGREIYQLQRYTSL